LSISLPNEPRMAINAVPELACGQEAILQLSFLKNTNGTYVMNPVGTYVLGFSFQGTLFDGYEVTLKDAFANTETVLAEGGSYSFTVTNDPLSLSENRFKIYFNGRKPRLDLAIEAPALVCDESVASMVIKSTQAGYTYQLISNGLPAGEPKISAGGDLSFSIQSKQLVAGSNTISAQVTGTCVNEFLTNTVEVNRSLVNIPKPIDGSRCLAGKVTLRASGASAEEVYYWYDSPESTTAIGVGAEFETPVLKESRSYFVAINSSTGCESKREEVRALVSNYEPAEITIVDGSLLQSNYPEGNQWLFNNEVIAGATDDTYRPTQSGLYGLRVRVGDCTAEAEIQFLVTAIEEMHNSGMDVFPNPFINTLYLRSVREAGENVIATVMDGQGKLVGQYRVMINPADRTGSLDLAHLPDGLYLITLTGNNSAWTFKVIKTDSKK
jgi:hypothetical protein